MVKIYDISGREHDRSVAEVLIALTDKALIYIIENEENWRRWNENYHSSEVDRRKIAANLSRTDGLKAYINDPARNQHYVISSETALVRSGFLRLQRKPKITLRIKEAEGDFNFPWCNADKFGSGLYFCRGTIDNIVEEVKETIGAYNKRAE